MIKLYKNLFFIVVSSFLIGGFLGLQASPVRITVTNRTPQVTFTIDSEASTAKLYKEMKKNVPGFNKKNRIFEIQEEGVLWYIPSNEQLSIEFFTKENMSVCIGGVVFVQYPSEEPYEIPLMPAARLSDLIIEVCKPLMGSLTKKSILTLHQKNKLLLNVNPSTFDPDDPDDPEIKEFGIQYGETLRVELQEELEEYGEEERELEKVRKLQEAYNQIKDKQFQEKFSESGYEDFVGFETLILVGMVHLIKPEKLDLDGKKAFAKLNKDLKQKFDQLCNAIKKDKSLRNTIGITPQEFLNNLKGWFSRSNVHRGAFKFSSRLNMLTYHF